MNLKKSTLVSLVLMLAVMVSSVAWTPAPVAQTGPNDPDSTPGLSPKWPTKYSRGRISARIIGDEVYLRGDRLPGRHSFFVKVRRNANGVWERLGAVESDKNGNMEDYFRLPQKLRKLNAVNICMKDILTNKAYCVTARR